MESTRFQSSCRVGRITIIKDGEDPQAYVMFAQCSLFDMLNQGSFSAMLGHQTVNCPYLGPHEIRPHRFGGEGVLIGGQTATLNA